jgi:hypothetical protein
VLTWSKGVIVDERVVDVTGGWRVVLRQYRGDYLKRAQEDNTNISKPKDFARDNKCISR